MPKQKTDDLMQLIRSLTRAEKRHFRLFVKRNQASEELLFLQLFDLLGKKGAYDEGFLLKKIPGLKKAQLANLKAHLKRQLLTSLRMLSLKKNEDIQIREMIDFSRVLYDKGLYRQALDLLARAKERALANQATPLALETLEFEKLIESQYITRSLEGRADELTSQTLQINERNFKTNSFSNLSLQMYGLYLKNGFARSEEDSKTINQYFESKLPKIAFEELDFLGKVYFCQSYVWLHYSCQDFLSCFKFAQKWVKLFEDRPTMRSLFAPFYLKGLHGLLYSLFLNLHDERFSEAFNLLKKFPEEVTIQTDNVRGLFYMYFYIHQINKHYLEGTFSDGVAIVPELSKYLLENKYNWDEYRIMIFNYRIACLYFGDEDYPNAIEYLNKIINEKTTDYRNDIQCFARVLNLLAHFELGNMELVEYQIRSVYRFLIHVEELQQVQKEIFVFLRYISKIHRSEHREAFKNLLKKLKPLERTPYESRPFLYLDIISWLDAKINGTTIQYEIRKKFLNRQAGRVQ